MPWIGPQIRAECEVIVGPAITAVQAHQVAVAAKHALHAIRGWLPARPRRTSGPIAGPTPSGPCLSPAGTSSRLAAVTSRASMTSCTAPPRQGSAAQPARPHQFRVVATGYGKRERIYQGTIDVASIRIWLRDPVT
jgi:hypothetical protein